MATLDELMQQLDTLKADSKMDREDRSDQMRKVRRQIRKLGGRLRDTPPPGQSSSSRSSRSKRRQIKVFKAREPEEMRDFTKELMRHLKKTHPEIQFSKIQVGQGYHAFPANLLMDEAENGGYATEALVELLIEKYYSRWGKYPDIRAVFSQGEIPILCFGSTPVVPGPNTPVFRQNSGKSW